MGVRHGLPQWCTGSGSQAIGQGRVTDHPAGQPRVLASQMSNSCCDPTTAAAATSTSVLFAGAAAVAGGAAAAEALKLCGQGRHGTHACGQWVCVSHPHRTTPAAATSTHVCGARLPRAARAAACTKRDGRRARARAACVLRSSSSSSGSGSVVVREPWSPQPHSAPACRGHSRSSTSAARLPARLPYTMRRSLR